MLVLGLNHGEINSSAAIVLDGNILAAAPEERFTREQKTKAFPARAVAYCLEAANSTIERVDCVAQGWNPGASWTRFEPLLSSMRLRREDYFYTIPDNLWDFTRREPRDWILMSFPEGCNLPPIYFVQHHRAHAANGFFLSPFEQAAILTCDWRGELECLTWGYGEANTIKPLQGQTIPNSLGMFYATYTELLGYRRDHDEWKVMALSAFDVDCREMIKKIRGTVRLLDDGSFEIDQAYYQGAILEKPELHTQKLVDLLGGREGKKNEEPDEWHFSVAKAMQTVSEEILAHNLHKLYEKTRCPNVVMSGGFALNSVFNGKISEKTPFRNVYIPFAPADLGNSIGAALYVTHCIQKRPRSAGFTNSYLGPQFSNENVEQSLIRRGLRYRKIENMARTVAQLLARGEVVACFRGRMEFGERALGNRSILADPRKADMKEKINGIIKYREGYRPFAPAVLGEAAHRFFDVPVGYECHFMEKVVPVRKEQRHALAAVTHVDGSCRLQTVQRDQNPPFYDLIEQFAKITGIPILLNTSFNINGEPIVHSPDDALNTFFDSGLRYLAIEDFMIEK
jgi:carbamoyltransferase